MDAMQEKMLQMLFAYIDENKEQLFSMVSDLIKINSENFGTTGNEKELALFVADQMEKRNIPSDVYSPLSIPGFTEHPDYLPGRNLENRPNVTGKFAGSEGKKSLMLAAHLDTMPIGDEKIWSVPPTGGLIRDGKIYGRGSNDDKYPLAIGLFLFEAFQRLGYQPKNDIYLTGYVDEEFGGGNGALACCLKYPCDFFMNIDGHGDFVYNSGAGGLRLVLTIKNPELQVCCRSILDGLFRSKEVIDKFGERRCAELAANPRFAKTELPGMGLRYLNFSTGLNTTDRDIGMLDFAFYTDRTHEQIQKELEELFADIRNALAPMGLVLDSVNYKSRLFRYAYAEDNNPKIERLQKIAADVTGRNITIAAMGLSDLNVILANTNGQAADFGVGRGFEVEGGAHQKDEFVECDGVVKMAKIVARYIMEWDEADE